VRRWKDFPLRVEPRQSSSLAGCCPLLVTTTGDIEKDEELTHTYISLEWRTCFTDLNKIVNGNNESA
jgi:hypothetical protein